MVNFGPILQRDIDIFKDARQAQQTKALSEQVRLDELMQELLTIDAKKLADTLGAADIDENVAIEGFKAWRLAKRPYVHYADARVCSNPYHSGCTETRRMPEKVGTEELLLRPKGLYVAAHAQAYPEEDENGDKIKMSDMDDLRIAIPRAALLQDVYKLGGYDQGWSVNDVRESMVALLIRHELI